MKAGPSRLCPLVVAVLIYSGCAAVLPFQPNLQVGGRAVSIAVRPGDARRLLVASETGGLFRTGDGGATWEHVDSLPSYVVTDAAYAPGSPDVVIATTQADFKNGNGCIWRSTDGGATWSQPPGAVPPEGPRCGARVSAYSVSFEPGTNKVYVGTDCGLAVSSDLGVSWTHVAPDPDAPVNEDKTQNRVWSVLAQSGGRVNLSAQDGLWFSTSGGSSWSRATSGPGTGQGGINHAFAASPFDSRHLFHAGGGNQLFLSSDGGANWSLVPSPTTWSRPAFVRVGLEVSGAANQLDVYFGDGTGVSRQTFTHSATGPVGSGTWTPLVLDHADPADLAFDSSGRIPILLATDGGVHRTRNRGASWTLTGGGTGGYNALQITEVTGQAVSGASPHQDLYFGTQDNSNHASSDGGATWPFSICCEGFFFRVTPTSVDHANTKVTGVTCAGCMNFITDAHFAGFAGWPTPPDGDANPGDVDGNPFLLRPAHYIQNSINNDAATFANAFQLTTDTGGTWSPSFTLTPELRSIPHVAGPPSAPTLYVAVRRPGTTSDGQQRIGLMRISNLFGSGPASVVDADVTGFGSLGIFPTMFAWYTVFGVNPHNPLHLIIPDIETNEMKQSVDGGRTWHVDADLTRVVTDSGAYRFRAGQFTLVNAIAFDPFNRCHVLVGTAQNGVARSTDGGRTWAKIVDSERITNLSSFYFPPEGDIIVSSYGRGLWKLRLDRTGGECPRREFSTPELGVPLIVDPATGARVPLGDLGNPEICPACQLILVRNGRVTDLALAGQQLQRLSMSGGTVHQLDTKQQKTGEVPLAIPNVYSTELGDFGGNKLLQSLAREKAPIRGLVIEGNTLQGVIISEAELPFTPARTPYVHAMSHDMGGGVPRLEAGGRLIVLGQGFAPGLQQENPVRIWLGGELVAREVKVDERGQFRAEIVLQNTPGDYELRVEQTEGKRLSRDKTIIKLVPHDERESPRQQRDNPR
jgi:photosystem II stability/assembly factor-like uncharacterized protein